MYFLEALCKRNDDASDPNHGESIKGLRRVGDHSNEHFEALSGKQSKV